MADGAAEAGWRPRHNPWAIALTVTLATFMEVLDTSIANVALPQIAGNIGASGDESTWVLTSYLPVKVLFDEGQDPMHLLGPGMSVVPTVRIR